MNKLRFLSTTGVVLATIAFATGCGFQVEVGPYPVEIPLGGGDIDPASFITDDAKVAFEGTIEEDLCSLPSEDEVAALLEQVGDLDISGLVEISRLELDNITITATSGDFSDVTEIVVTYIPKAVDGVQPDAVELASATSETGFGTTVTLTPSEDIDLLTLIQENDANTGDGCPSLQIYVKGDATDEASTITWEGQANVNVYALVGLG